MNFDAANNQDAGFIKIWQSLRNWEWIDDPNMLALWVHLLLKANWKDNNWKGQVIKRGQCVIGRHKLSQETGISERSLRTCLERLKSTNELTIKTTSKYSILTIEKYDIYNPIDKKATSKTTSETPSSDHQATTLKEGEEGKEVEDNLFDEFWKEYPAKKGKKDARKAYDAAVKKTPHKLIMQGLQKYKEFLRINPQQQIKMAQGWLNSERFNDEYTGDQMDNSSLYQKNKEAAQRLHKRCLEAFQRDKLVDESDFTIMQDYSAFLQLLNSGYTEEDILEQAKFILNNPPSSGLTGWGILITRFKACNY